MNEPTEWQNYDQSSLPNLLRHDRWNRHCGVSLISGIDPHKSEVFYPLQYYKIPSDEANMFSAETGIDLEIFEYWKIQLLSDPPNSARRTWYESYMENEKSLDALLKDRYVAQEAFDANIQIFRSNPDHDPLFVAHPNYFIDWAKAKNLDISWLEWAKARKLISATSEKPKSPTANGKEDKRRVDSCQAMIGALLRELEIDHNKRGIAKKVEGITKDFGAHVRYDTVLDILAGIDHSIEAVQDRK